MRSMPSKSWESELVHDSLPFGMDNGSTLPMEVSPGTIPTSVVQMLEGEDQRVKDSADPGGATTNATSKPSADGMPQALTSKRVVYQSPFCSDVYVYIDTFASRRLGPKHMSNIPKLSLTLCIYNGDFSLSISMSIQSVRVCVWSCTVYIYICVCLHV